VITAIREKQVSTLKKKKIKHKGMTTIFSIWLRKRRELLGLTFDENSADLIRVIVLSPERFQLSCVLVDIGHLPELTPISVCRHISSHAGGHRMVRSNHNLIRLRDSI
jgi:hypothetical protein